MNLKSGSVFRVLWWITGALFVLAALTLAIGLALNYLPFFNPPGGGANIGGSLLIMGSALPASAGLILGIVAVIVRAAEKRE